MVIPTPSYHPGFLLQPPAPPEITDIQRQIIEIDKANATTRQFIIFTKAKILREVTEKIENNLATQKKIIEETIELTMDRFCKKQEELSDLNRLEQAKERQHQVLEKEEQVRIDKELE